MLWSSEVVVCNLGYLAQPSRMVFFQLRPLLQEQGEFLERAS